MCEQRTRPNVFVTGQLPEQLRERLESQVDAGYWAADSIPTWSDLAHAVKHCEGVLSITGNDRIDRELLEVAPHLRVISNNGIGCDNIDVAACTERGVLVTNTPGANSSAVADLAFGLLIATARRICELDRVVKAGEWTRIYFLMEMIASEVHGTTLGLVGAGTIGAQVAKRARGFDMRVLYTSRRRHPELEREYGLEYRTLDELLRESDFVSLHVPLNDETRHLIGERELGLMKPTAILINTARGAVLDQDALVKALENRLIGGAGLDVTSPEPLPADHPLLALDNCVITPHRAAATLTTRLKQTGQAVDNLVGALTGGPVNAYVNRVETGV